MTDLDRPTPPSASDMPRTSVRLAADTEPIGGLLARRAADLGDKTFVHLPDDGVTLSYRQVEQRARRLASGLHARGLAPGDRVAIVLPNGADAIVGWFACLLGGLVDTAVSPELTGASLRYAVEKVGASLVLTDLDHLDQVAEVTRSGGIPVVCAGLHEAGREPGPDLHDLAAVESGKPSHELRPAPFEELSSIRFTSGSTGLPKGIMMSAGHMRASAQMFCQITGFDHDDVVYSPFPLHHVLASVTGVLAALEAGGTISLARRFSASRFWEHVHESGATVTQALDPVVSILGKAEPRSSDRDHTVRCMYTAAGAFPGFEERFGLWLVRMFDMSELATIARYRPGEAQRPGSCGRESELFSVATVDELDRPVAPGETGEIVVRPKLPNVMMLGYYGDDEQTVRQWRNLWFHTGDRGSLDDDGFLFFSGRSSDRIRHRGVNVSPEQVEAEAREDEDVADCAAIAVPSDVSEDDVKLCVERPPGSSATAEEIGRRLRARMSQHLRPRYVEVYERLPRTETEKIRKGVLRSEGRDGITPGSWDGEAG